MTPRRLLIVNSAAIDPVNSEDDYALLFAEISKKRAAAGIFSIPEAIAAGLLAAGAGEASVGRAWRAASLALQLGACAFCRVLGERPLNVLAHHRRWVLFAGGERGEHGRRGRRIAECNGDIAQPALIADAADGAAAGPFFELRFAPGKQVDQLRPVQSVPDREILLGRRARELVPRTHQLAVVATVDAIADRAAKFDRECSPRARS